MRFSGPALVEPLTAALEHRKLPEEPHQNDAIASTADSGDDLVVQVFDTASTGCEPPPPRRHGSDYSVRGAVRGMSRERYWLAAKPGTASISGFDAERCAGVFWIESPAALTVHERSFPLRDLLRWWGEARGLQLAHAAAVGRSDGVVAICGGSGSGKSTTALAAWASGLAYLGDDNVLLGASPPMVHRLYVSAKVEAWTLERLPELERSVAVPPTPDGEKALLFLGSDRTEHLPAAAPLRAILVPEIGKERTAMVPASRGTALAALAGPSVFLGPGADAAALAGLARVVREVPTFGFELCPDLAAIGPAIEDLLNGLGTEAAAAR